MPALSKSLQSPVEKLKSCDFQVVCWEDNMGMEKKKMTFNWKGVIFYFPWKADFLNKDPTM